MSCYLHLYSRECIYFLGRSIGVNYLYYKFHDRASRFSVRELQQPNETEK
jgi:hypothetical protein